MNLEESNSFMHEEEKKNKKKKVVFASIGICVLLILLIIIFIIFIQVQDSNTLKMFINGSQINISSTLYEQVNDTTYINVKEFSAMLGYQYTQGEYNQYNENETSCYITNDFETVSFTAEEKIFTKYAETVNEKSLIAEIPVTTKSQVGEAQKYNLNGEIKLIEGMLYVPFESATDIFNVKLDLSTKNRIKIYTLEQVVVSAKNVIARLQKYTTLDGGYENLKAMLYGFAVVGNDNSGVKYGVISLQTGEPVLSLRYEDITFIPNSQYFLVKAGGNIGIFSNTGDTIIEPKAYDDITVYDDVNQLYLVKKDNKYGILNKEGEVIVYPDYDEIGYKFSDGNRTTEYKLIFDKCIPVKEGNKYGLFSIDGEELLSCSYDYLGSKNVEKNTNEKPILLIPPEVGIKGIVVSQNDMYGIYDVGEEKGNFVIPCSCTKIYSITRTAKTTYYIEHADTKYDLEEYLDVLGLKSVTTKSEESEDNDIIENENTTMEEKEILVQE